MRLLIIGTLKGQIGAASKIAMRQGGQVLQAESIAEGIEILRSGQGADLTMVDVGLDIHELIERLEIERISVPVVACGIQSDARAAVKAIKAGAREYIPLPPDADLIGAVLAAVSRENHALIHNDPATARIIQMADQFAPSDASVLITGESGTGKEVFSRYMHNQSKRAGSRFVAVNCAAIPENLLESELFGYEKGAFTGAVSRRIGKFEEANNGTLLLDEISEMDVRLQAKLLRVLQEKEIDRIGGKKPVSVNVRILATSNRNMAEVVRQGTFREDLYYRLNVVNLDLPALRNRPGDILPLARHFITKYSKLNEMPVKPLSEQAQLMLQRHPWPGNVRELENTIHRAVLMSPDKQIEQSAIMLSPVADTAAATLGGNGNAQPPAPPQNTTQYAPQHGAATGGYPQQASAHDQTAPQQAGASFVGRTVASVERDLIIDTLKHTFGNRTHAANILGISIRTLRNKLKIYNEKGFSVPDPGQGN